MYYTLLYNRVHVLLYNLYLIDTRIICTIESVFDWYLYLYFNLYFVPNCTQLYRGLEDWSPFMTPRYKLSLLLLLLLSLYALIYEMNAWFTSDEQWIQVNNILQLLLGGLELFLAYILSQLWNV